MAKQTNGYRKMKSRELELPVMIGVKIAWFISSAISNVNYILIEEDVMQKP